MTTTPLIEVPQSDIGIEHHPPTSSPECHALIEHHQDERDHIITGSNNSNTHNSEHFPEEEEEEQQRHHQRPRADSCSLDGSSNIQSVVEKAKRASTSLWMLLHAKVRRKRKKRGGKYPIF